MSTQSDRELLEFRRQMRDNLKKEYLRQYWDPYRHAARESGHVFDPAIQRFLSMRACQYDYFKVTPRTAPYPLLFFVPFGILSYLVYQDRSSLNEKVSTGQIAYKDRKYKFMN